jgi:hypothetical protein
MVTSAVPHQFSTRLHAHVIQVVWIIIDVTNSIAAVAAGCLKLALFRTGVDAAKNYSFVLASCKCFFYANGTIHLGGICAAFDQGWVSTVELLRHSYLATVATRDKACQLALMQSSNAKSLAGLLTLDFGVILRHQVTNFVAPVTTVESIITEQSAAPSGRVLQRISRVLKVKGLGWVDFAPERFSK